MPGNGSPITTKTRDPSRTWVDDEWDRFIARRRELEKMDPDARVPCIVCGGSAHPQCGCDGTTSAREAIADIDCELEILCK